MNELQRQAYLKAMGLTPWVARTPLLGAAETPYLEWPAPVLGATSVPQHSSAPFVPATITATGAANSAEPIQQAQAQKMPVVKISKSAASQAPEPGPRPSVKPYTGLRITLQAYQVGDLWLLAEQDDPSAPDLGREALQLLHNIMAIFPGERRGERRFVWPVSDIAMDADALSKTFQSFSRALGSRILLCVSENFATQLLGAPRYQLIPGTPPILPVSSLPEMLSEPAAHKRQTWQAILNAGFND